LTNKGYIKRCNNTVKEIETLATGDITSPLLKRKPINNFICTNLHRSIVEGLSPTDAHIFFAVYLTTLSVTCDQTTYLQNSIRHPPPSISASFPFRHIPVSSYKLKVFACFVPSFFTELFLLLHCFRFFFFFQGHNHPSRKAAPRVSVLLP
jgi:hypothetical protein